MMHIRTVMLRNLWIIDAEEIYYYLYFLMIKSDK